MTSKDLFREFGNIDSKMIEAAAPEEKTIKRNANVLVKWTAIAACLAFILSGVFLYNTFHSTNTPDNNIMSYFIITAHAATGESKELVSGEGFFNSVPAQEGNGFGVDMPLFNFSVKPSDLKNNEAIYDRFDISVSYNGSLVKDKDEHVSVAYLIPIASSNEPWSYSIMGWFTESTDIIINILDKESSEIVETITVNVKYLADKQEYELKVTNLTTKFSEQQIMRVHSETVQ